MRLIRFTQTCQKKKKLKKNLHGGIFIQSSGTEINPKPEPTVTRKGRRGEGRTRNFASFAQREQFSSQVFSQVFHQCWMKVALEIAQAHNESHTQAH